MKKTLFIVLLLGISSLAFSQAPVPVKKDTTAGKAPKMTPEERACDIACHMIKEYDLNWAQATKIHDAALIHETKLQALKAKASTDKKAEEAEGKKIDDEYDAAVKAVLTPDQYSKYQTRRQLEQQKKEIKRKEDSLQGKH
jgi:periplasmic protein CpxP/Spy